MQKSAANSVLSVAASPVSAAHLPLLERADGVLGAAGDRGPAGESQRQRCSGDREAASHGLAMIAHTHPP